MKNVWKNFYIILFGVFISMTVLGMNTPTYPYMSKELNINPAYIAWMSASYSVGAAILAPMMGKLGDRFGIKKMSVMGLVIFTIASLLIAISPVYSLIILGRFLQGLGVACLLPSCMAFIGIYIDQNESSKAFSIFGAACSAGVIFGPVISGFLSEAYGFRSVFFTASVASAIAAVIMLMLLEKTPVVQMRKGPFDYIGSVFLLVGMSSLLILPTLGASMGYKSPIALVLLIIGVIFMIAFVKREKSFDNPIVRISLFKNRDFLIPSLLYLGYNGLSQIFLYAVSYYFTQGLLKGVEVTGIWTMFVFIVMTISAIGVAKLMKELAWKKVAFIAMIPTVISVILFAFSKQNSSMALYYIGAFMLGLSGSFNTPLNTAQAMLKVPKEIKGASSGTFRLIGDMGGPIFVTIFLPLMTVFGKTDSGVDYVSAFPKLMWALLIPVAIMFVLTLMYPKNENA